MSTELKSINNAADNASYFALSATLLLGLKSNPVIVNHIRNHDMHLLHCVTQIMTLQISFREAALLIPA